MQDCPALELSTKGLNSSLRAHNAENDALELFAPAENGPKTIKSAFWPLRPSRRIFVWPVLPTIPISRFVKKTASKSEHSTKSYGSRKKIPSPPMVHPTLLGDPINNKFVKLVVN